MPHRFLSALAPLLVAALAGATVSGRQAGDTALQSLAQSGRQVHRGTVSVEGAPPVAFTIISDRDNAAITRLSDTAASAIQLLIEWFGPLNQESLTIVDVPWNVSEPGASAASVVATRVRWITPERDATAERTLIAGLARQFWVGTDPAEASFREALTMFAATRGIHAVLAGRNFAAPRFLGGFVSMPLRSLQLSPNLVGPRPLLDEFDEVIQPAEAPWRFSSSADGTPARRAAMALQTLERAIGWPATQQALAEVRAGAAGGAITPEMLAAVLGEQRGVSMDWFVREVVRGSGPIDYAVGAIENDSAGGEVTTRVTIERRGNGTYSGTDQPRAAGVARSIQVLARFEDASEARAFADGRDGQSQIIFASRSPVAAVMIDPDEQLLMDHDRSNNGRLVGKTPVDRTGLRLVMNWVIWLQNAMLTYAAIA